MTKSRMVLNDVHYLMKVVRVLRIIHFAKSGKVSAEDILLQLSSLKEQEKDSFFGLEDFNPEKRAKQKIT